MDEVHKCVWLNTGSRSANILYMDDELQESINQVKVLVEENNKMLHSIQRRARLATLWHIIYWIIIVGVSIGALYYIQPYYEQTMELYQSAKETQAKFSNLPKGFDLNSLKSYFQ